jgi:3'(2'), 5'-bisphosphate nucleotidase
MASHELTTASAIAREAGKILLSIYATDFVVDFKGQGQNDPVTEADRRANALIVQRLAAAFPNDGIVAEESDNQRETFSRERIWYVDPLDGTKEFVAKNGEFSVMIGLAVGGRARLGVVLQPSQDKLYLGEIGQGAWLVERGQQRAVAVSGIADVAELGLIVSRSHRPGRVSELKQRLGIRRESVSGSVGLKVGHIAEQHADLYVHMSDKSSAWDTCAPEAILLAAGGRFTDLFGQEIVYGKTDVRTRRGILACNAAAFDRVAPVVSELAARSGFTASSPTPAATR